MVLQVGKMRTSAIFLILFLSYLTWHATSLLELLVGCMMLAFTLLELVKFEWVRWQLQRLKNKR